MQIGFLLVLGQKLENGKIFLSNQCFALISYCDGTNGFAMLPKACKLRHLKKIWFSANQVRAGLKRLGYVSIYPKKNFKSIAGLEP